MTLHILPDLEQGTEEWFAARRGIVTASVVGRLLSVGTLGALHYDCPACDAPAEEPCIGKRGGKPMVTSHTERAAAAKANPRTTVEPADGDEARNLTLLLAAERITGFGETSFVNDDMMRGTLCEPIARDAYAQRYGVQVDQVGFMRRDEEGWTLGVSPDGLVGEEGCIEIKAPRAKQHVRTVVTDEVPAQHTAQCQAALLVSGRKWLDFVSFYGGLPLFVKRVYPEFDWFDAIAAACVHFEMNVEQIVTTYNRAVVGLPMTERVDFDMEMTP